MKNNDVNTGINDNGAFTDSNRKCNTALHLDEIIQILLSRIGPLYNIDCIALMLYDEDINNIEITYVSEADQTTKNVISHIISDAKQLNRIQKEIAGFQFPVLRSRQEWVEAFGENHCVVKNTDMYLHHCYIPLEIGNRVLGTLGVHNITKELSSEALNFCSNISDILAEGVSLLRKRTAEETINEIIGHIPSKNNASAQFYPKNYEVLFNLSLSLPTVKSYAELMAAIDLSFVQLGLPEENAIGIIGQTPDLITTFLFGNKFKSDKLAGNKINIAQNNKPDNSTNWITELDEPSIINIHDLGVLRGAFANLATYHENKIHDYIGVALKEGGRTGGILMIPFKNRELAEKVNLQTVKSAALLISASLFNLIRAEEISVQERYKNILLSLTSDFSRARTKDEITFNLHKRLSQFLEFSQLLIRIISPDKKSHRSYYSSTEDFKGLNSSALLVPGVCKGEDFILNELSNLNAPLMLDLNELMKTGKPADYMIAWHKKGIRKTIIAPLICRKEVCGFLVINMKDTRHFSNEEYSLIKGMADHVASAITNMAAFEQIDTQLAEINNIKEQLSERQLYDQEHHPQTGEFADIIGNGPAMSTIFELLSRVSDSETTVLILGETGTGKELIARAIHNNSNRKNKPMIKINCAAIPANLIESELFGHEKGSFTGATERRIGKFELANNSTIFLDEMGELPMELQVKLLRVLQEKEFERIGGRTTLKTDVRIVSATNRNLQDEVEAGNFRADLFYRLNVFPIKLPPLRERMDDLPILAKHFLTLCSRKVGKSISGFSNKAMQRLGAYHWPGNIRELEHLIERHVLLAQGAMITDIKIPSANKVVLVNNNEPMMLKTLFENERDYIFSVLHHCNGRISGQHGAAKILGLPATTLNSKIKKLGLTKTHRA